MHDIKRILVVSRWTQECKKALHYGISLARAYHTELSILHIIRDTFELSGGVLYMPRLADFQEGYRHEVEEVKRDFAAMIAEEKAAGMIINETIRDGQPADEVFKMVAADKIDLVIAAHHEEDRIEHYLFCRDYERVIRKMPCNIMLVKTEPWTDTDRRATGRSSS